MSLTNYYKFLMLNDGDIVGDDGYHQAHANREMLIRQLFPKATPAEQKYICDITEFNDAMREHMDVPMPKDVGNHYLEMYVATKLQKLMQISRQQNKPNAPPPLWLLGDEPDSWEPF
jgi:hypothetical protein